MQQKARWYPNNYPNQYFLKVPKLENFQSVTLVVNQKNKNKNKTETNFLPHLSVRHDMFTSSPLSERCFETL